MTNDTARADEGARARLRDALAHATKYGGRRKGEASVGQGDLRETLDLLASNEAALAEAGKRIGELSDALRPFAEPHAMGDNYVQFAPRLILAARAALLAEEN